MAHRRRILKRRCRRSRAGREQVGGCRRSPRCGQGGARAGAPACRPDRGRQPAATAFTQSATGGRCRATQRPRWLTAGTATVLAGPAASSSRCRGSGACSSTACTLVPDIPNDETPPSAADRSPVGQSSDLLRNEQAGFDCASSSGSAVKCSVAGTFPARSDRIALISPTAPAADSAWPTLLFDRADRTRLPSVP